MSNPFGLVCATICQGLTVSVHDIYVTKEEADAELVDLRQHEELEDDDDDFMVIELFLQPDGSYHDEAGSVVTVIGEA